MNNADKRLQGIINPNVGLKFDDEGYSSSALNAAATDTIIRSGKTRLFRATILGASNPTISFIDNSSFSSTSVLFSLEPGAGRGTYDLSYEFSDGLFVSVSDGSVPQVLIRYRTDD